jgi:hypothetical protein
MEPGDKADVARAEGISRLQNEEWAVGEASNYKNKVELAEIASSRFNVTVVQHFVNLTERVIPES